MTAIEIIEATKAAEKPNYTKHAAELLERCREFYQNPENERAFQEWMKSRKAAS